MQNRISRHRLKEILREDAGKEFLEVQRAGLQTRGGIGGRQGQAQTDPRLCQVDEQQANRERDQRGHQEPQQGLDADTTDGTSVIHTRNTRHDRGKHQWCNDHLDQSQEGICHQREVAGHFLGRCRVGCVTVAQITDGNTEDHAEHDHAGGFVR